MLCVPKMPIALALIPIQRKINFNVVDTFIRVSGLFILFIFFCGCIGFLQFNSPLKLQKNSITPTSGVISHYILLHPVGSRTSRASDLRIQFIQHSSPIDSFSSSEAALLLVSTKNRDLWPCPTTEVRDSRTSRHSAHALSKV